MSRYSRDDSSREGSSNDLLERSSDPETRQNSESERPLAERAETAEILRQNTRSTLRAPRSLRETVRDGPSRTWSAANHLDLPRTPERRPVILGRDRFMLRNSESELIATVGVFRAIPLRDLKPVADNAIPNQRSSFDADIRSLRKQGLIETHTILMNGRPESVAVVTFRGRDLIEKSHAPRSSPLAAREQRFHAGPVKLRQLEHDAQIFRVFQTERERLEAEGATVTRVVLGVELKGDYQRHLGERRAFAEEHHLSFAGERLHIPDVRVEYETADGRSEYRDLELATDHYSRGQLNGKAAAGFRIYRAAGTFSERRRGGGQHPHHLEWIS